MKKFFKFFNALFNRVTKGENVNYDVYAHRVATCIECPFRKDLKCGICGCNVTLKSQWSTEKCPDDKW